MAKRAKPAERHHKGRELRTLKHAIEFLLELEQIIMAVDQKIVDAQARLDASISALNAKVDALVASQGAGAADVDAIVSKTNAQADAVDAEAAKITPVV